MNGQQWTSPAPASGSQTTALALLQGGGVNIHERLATSGTVTDSAGKVNRGTASVWEAVHDQLTRLVESFLTVDASLVLLVGLGRTQDLLEAAWRTRDSDEGAAVEVNGQGYTLRQHPSIDLMIGDTVLSSLLFELTVAVHVGTLSVEVEHARLTRLTSGSVKLSVNLTCNGVDLGSATKTVEPRLVMNLGQGWPLLPDLALA
jgi:hypothetical protein